MRYIIDCSMDEFAGDQRSCEIIQFYLEWLDERDWPRGILDRHIESRFAGTTPSEEDISLYLWNYRDVIQYDLPKQYGIWISEQERVSDFSLSQKLDNQVVDKD